MSEHDQRPDAELVPAAAGEPAVKATERPHPLTPLIRGWLAFVVIVFALGRDLLPIGGRDEGTPPWYVFVVGAVGIAIIAAAVGLLSWWFTKFVIDDDELRIETGFVNRTSKKVPFGRIQSIDVIQPLAARIFGLAELKIEVGGSQDSGVRLRFLNRAKATRLRDYLLRRAHGEQVSMRDTDTMAEASALTDLSADDRVLVRLSPAQLILGFLLSADFYLSAFIVIVLLGVFATLSSVFAITVAWAALPGLLPVAIGLASTIGRRLISQFNYSLSRTGRGLRISRGLTSLTSQSVPVDRIQGVRIRQAWLWRFTGWYTVDVDVLGNTATGEQGEDSSASSLLLPVATREQLAVALAEVLPGVDLDAIVLRHSPERAKWVHWFTSRRLTWGFDELVIVTGHGLLTKTLNVVPHAKAQSVRIVQGPLQRRVGLASVVVDTTNGPVNLVARQLAPATARELALSELGRAAHARRLIAEKRDVPGVAPQQRDRWAGPPSELSGPVAPSPQPPAEPPSGRFG